ncbi:ATP phosphoribosyltransferase regulatory subunit [Thermoanaerobacterium thermosaccharolyticum]|jgi:ATP phosphoribosyltransferase regulatory subunit|uniref:ATP phosphoribosyltransferase regulatory subunit n=1 Tax=Thermoanaerobacterium thermosaccharolyticum TaxID=1517 RepID=A0A223I097_THETR|nr:ATP phosphoribosyltransferase regulatory subunit [Thermoanaerobacterium thermosaccharolyticum]AST58119.1 ATP phosphoribosyltransferase [Thermoanaerobacterium thermosaccharolyticum]KAA5808521.1 ATP phosphoribosyltransferase regulatory subunit [Thermoanaerobacterium thermosaccharolyticum]PHO07128.1 ATP phosphoribosyltransferase regulatory subunit [Thermoanaerobacterium thermosaccharolyticum]
MKNLPDGVQDFLPEELRFKHSIENILRKTFESSGYEEIMPPTFEYMENFSNTSGIFFDENNLYRFFDKKGDLLALRPDVTTQVARIASTKYNEYPLKFCYIANVYRYDNPQVGRMREYTQAGIELIGRNHEYSDAECISVAVEALKNIGIKDFKVDIGQAEFFKSLLDELGLARNEEQVLKELLEQKNQSEIEYFLKNNNITGHNYELIVNLPLFFGDIEIIKKAKDVYKFEKANRTLNYLERVYDILKDFGMDKYITFDLGMVQSIDYYTGLIFRIFVKDLGYAICAGGRYDNLLKNYGKDLPATGFAISVERAMLAVQNQSEKFTKKPKSVAVLCNDSSRKEAYHIALKLRNEGNIAELVIKGNEDYLKKKRFDEIIKVGVQDG